MLYLISYVICVSLAGPGVARSRAQLSLDSRQVSRGRAYLCRVVCALRRARMIVSGIPVVRESAALRCWTLDAEELGT